MIEWFRWILRLTAIYGLDLKKYSLDSLPPAGFAGLVRILASLLPTGWSPERLLRDTIREPQARARTISLSVIGGNCTAVMIPHDFRFKRSIYK